MSRDWDLLDDSLIRIGYRDVYPNKCSLMCPLISEFVGRFIFFINEVQSFQAIGHSLATANKLGNAAWQELRNSDLFVRICQGFSNCGLMYTINKIYAYLH